MTHRAPLSPLSTTHEPWPLIQHMWVWDAVAIATSVSGEAFARCPWIVRVSSFESVCRCMMTAVVEMCEGKRAVDALPLHRPVSLWRLAACICLEPSGSKGSLSEWERNLCHPSFLMRCLRIAPLPNSTYLSSPARKANADPRWIFHIETWKTMTIKKGVELFLGQCFGNTRQHMIFLRVYIIPSSNCVYGSLLWNITVIRSRTGQ